MRCMRMNRSLAVVLAFLLALAAGCGESSADGRSSRDRGDSRAAGGKQSGQSSDEQQDVTAAERLNNTPLLELSLTPENAEAEYDPAAVISFGLELFSPRAFAVGTFERYGGEDKDKVELPTLGLQDLGGAFPSQIMLYEVSGPSERAIPVVFSTVSEEADVKLGEGDVAAATLFIEPGAFEASGEVVLQARIDLEEYGTVESPPLTMTLTQGSATPQEAATARLRLLVATGKLDEARALGAQVVADYPEAMQPHLILAHVYELSGDLQSALDTYRKALVLVPEGQEEPPVLIIEKIRTLMEALDNR